MTTNSQTNTKTWYAKYAQSYAEESEHTGSQKHIDQFSQYLASGNHVLDVGCGAGRDTHLLAEKGFEVIGLDVSPELLAIAQQKYPQLTFVEGTMLKLPFNDRYFGGIWAHASLLHLESVDYVKKTLTEFRRVLKDTGIVHVLVRAQTGDKKITIENVEEGVGRTYQYFTKNEFTELLEEADFTVFYFDQYAAAHRPNVQWMLFLARKN